MQSMSFYHHNVHDNAGFVFFRASMIWIIGEYAERIENANELLESFLEGFSDENSQVSSV